MHVLATAPRSVCPLLDRALSGQVGCPHAGTVTAQSSEPFQGPVNLQGVAQEDPGGTDSYRPCGAEGPGERSTACPMPRPPSGSWPPGQPPFFTSGLGDKYQAPRKLPLTAAGELREQRKASQCPWGWALSPEQGRAGSGGARPLSPESSGCERARGPWPCARAVGTAGEVTSALELDQSSSTQSNHPPLRRKEQNTVTGPQGLPH